MAHAYWRLIGTTQSLIPWDDAKSNPKSSDAESNSRGVGGELDGAVAVVVVWWWSCVEMLTVWSSNFKVVKLNNHVTSGPGPTTSQSRTAAFISTTTPPHHLTKTRVTTNEENERRTWGWAVVLNPQLGEFLIFYLSDFY